jgi:sugar O-acyltransferase (sialic acid O-acetyltransferase NeuD family)
MQKKLIIIGAGGAGREAADIFFRLKMQSNLNIELIGYLDDNQNLLGREINSVKVIGSNAWIPNEDEYFVCAIANRTIRKKIIDNFQIKNANFINLIDPSSIISNSATIGIGNIIYPYTIISSNVNVGNYNIINMHSILGHDAKIGDNNIISSFCDVTGFAEIGNSTFLGSHVSVHPKIKIGSECQIGIGSIVITDVKDGKKVFGYPAKKLDL